MQAPRRSRRTRGLPPELRDASAPATARPLRATTTRPSTDVRTAINGRKGAVATLTPFLAGSAEAQWSEGRVWPSGATAATNTSLTPTDSTTPTCRVRATSSGRTRSATPCSGLTAFQSRLSPQTLVFSRDSRRDPVSITRRPLRTRWPPGRRSCPTPPSTSFMGGIPLVPLSLRTVWPAPRSRPVSCSASRPPNTTT